MNSIVIRNMESEDIDNILELENMSFSTPWSKESFIKEIKENKLARYIVAKNDTKIVGYGGMWLILDEAHITNIAVHPEYRGEGVGTKLLNGLVEISKEMMIKRMTLEVRKSNDPAIKLYKNNDFVEVGIRPGYYSDTNEDAIIMWKEVLF
ncbi:ribosomal protein S18-alanine N-acetyltransferase [Senegalia massiliensis]|uniref:[Ribosomal protein bS18]-alanine N-acetyltransferase n=1 Tax=Senegalia massiliensis TaxID=1720316 RepID=A0A845QYT7_9CLOT|nr:ribosomal protein S18-alanine N-acetyltransferase [Senegalia massiliensis]NBI07320.1 ribosomal-protein-alanine N-acetyltransferase [Senegalia massiliensis]